MPGRVDILVANPVKPVVETGNACKMTEDGVTLTAVTDDDPHPSAPRILKNGTQKLRMAPEVVLRIYENEARALAMQINDCLAPTESYCGLKQCRRSAEETLEGRPKSEEHIMHRFRIALVQQLQRQRLPLRIRRSPRLRRKTPLDTTLGKWACAAVLLCTATATLSAAVSFGTLVKFDGADGSQPAALIWATDGNFYGTTNAGGATNYGTVFKMTPGGKLTTLYTFCAAADCADGTAPGSLIQASDGNFYGTTASGGDSASPCAAMGCGTVFKITPGGVLTTLHRFNYNDGAYPAGLVQASDGNLYGTTSSGGLNYGTVFKITLAGDLTTLHNFSNDDGATPYTGLVQATDGNFYGTTAYGGTGAVGVVFKITPAGHLTTLYSFCSEFACADGTSPMAGLLQGTDGNLYGTTYGGGSNGPGCGNLGCGTVFRITLAGKLTTLHSFVATDGRDPGGNLIQANDGNFYGTTPDGGYQKNDCGTYDGCGTIFQMTPAGKLTTVVAFESTQTASPYGLLQNTSGTFYGANAVEGANAYGSLFSLMTGLGPFVETRPTSGTAGTQVIILGDNLTGATAVNFNGKPASFTVISQTEIRATVPKGATTGFIQVTSKTKAMLKSNVPFSVP
jgi:uncharacterized repeat protein (TIGR03803 family)